MLDPEFAGPRGHASSVSDVMLGPQFMGPQRCHGSARVTSPTERRATSFGVTLNVTSVRDAHAYFACVRACVYCVRDARVRYMRALIACMRARIAYRACVQKLRACVRCALLPSIAWHVSTSIFFVRPKFLVSEHKLMAWNWNALVQVTWSTSHLSLDCFLNEL